MAYPDPRKIKQRMAIAFLCSVSTFAFGVFHSGVPPATYLALLAVIGLAWGWLTTLYWGRESHWYSTAAFVVAMVGVQISARKLDTDLWWESFQGLAVMFAFGSALIWFIANRRNAKTQP